MSKEELGQLVASRWTGEKIDKESKEDYAGEIHKEEDKHDDILDEDLYEDDDDGYVSDSADDNQKYEYGNLEDEIHGDPTVEDHSDSTSNSGSDSDSDGEPDLEGQLFYFI